MMPWLVRHAGWWFSARPSGHTPREALRGRVYRNELVKIGERVCAKKPGDAQNLSKLDSRWESGLWVGRTETSEGRLVSTPESGVSRMRLVRRRPAS